MDGNKAGEIWAIALNEDGQFLASTTYDGRINVWDLGEGKKKIREYETKGSFGMCIDMSRDGKFTASGHENGAVYVFNNDTGRMMYSLPGKLCVLDFRNFAHECRSRQARSNHCLLASWYTTGSSRRRKSHCPI